MKSYVFILTLLILAGFAGCKKKNDVNKAPVANAGQQRVIQLPENAVTLSGNGQDPDGSISTYLWTTVSGPATPTIETPNSPSTRVRNLAKGLYVFKLTVTDDDGATGTDTVTVTVISANNKVPVANAGTSLTITLPVDIVNVSGTGVDSDGSIVGYLWSQVSGPSSAAIDNPGAASTQIKSLKEGKYVFQFMVVDNEGSTGIDTMSVTVNPNPIKTLTLQPFNNPNERHVLGNNSGFNQGDSPTEFSATTWTIGGNPVSIRGLFRFDLSSIPANATIISAQLSLYSNPNPLNGNLVDANFGTNNSFLIQRITQNWSAPTTTWSNQPSTTTANQLLVPHTNQRMLDLIDLDVKNLIQDMQQNGNFGFLIKLQTEQIFNSRNFCSSRNSLADKRPKLVVVYQ